ncbi:carbon-nitrogen hydrolase [Planctomicrobium sp. SH661]|uniref:carbon-nitrogen hydrolase n=1 Tax=Planctomicrobium sp. SH661 TaxID=3448124 RepID=UPI003F5B3D4F
MSKKVNVALVQRSVSLDPEENLRETAADIERAAQQGANIICTQELFRSQYFCQSEDYDNFELAESIPGPSTELLAPIAKKHGVVIIASLFERRTQGLYHNTAVVLDADGSQLGIYRKMHIPDDPLYYEKFYFTPGDLGFKAFQTKFGKIGVLICWDQWYPEGARLTALAGAEILFYPTAIGWHPAEKAELGTAQHSSWETMQRSHAIANGVYVAAPNRCGHEGDKANGIEFWGQSFICDPTGTILKKASSDKPEIIMAECDLGKIDFQRTHWPFLRDRRIDAYGEIVKRYRD